MQTVRVVESMEAATLAAGLAWWRASFHPAHDFVNHRLENRQYPLGRGFGRIAACWGDMPYVDVLLATTRHETAPSAFQWVGGVRVLRLSFASPKLIS